MLKAYHTLWNSFKGNQKEQKGKSAQRANCMLLKYILCIYYYVSHKLFSYKCVCITTYLNFAYLNPFVLYGYLLNILNKEKISKAAIVNYPYFCWICLTYFFFFWLQILSAIEYFWAQYYENNIFFCKWMPSCSA